LLGNTGAWDHRPVVERTPETADAETALNVGMAAERTWLA
jgi:hypothetical protein